MEINFNNNRFWFILILLLSLGFRVYLFGSVGSILGADVGRFTIISHVWYLKKQIATDLRPYDLARGFFYFPGVFLLPFIFEFIGIDPVTSVTFFSFLFSFLGTLVFYKIARVFLSESKAIASFFFYSLGFDIVLIFNFFGLFSYGFASFFFLVVLWQLLEKKPNFFLMTLGLFGIFMFHWYLFMVLCIALLSIFTYQFVEDRIDLNFWKLFCLSFILASLISLPFVLPFLKYFRISFDVERASELSKENYVDLLTFTARRLEMNAWERFKTIFFVSYVGTIFSPFLLLGFFFSILTIILRKKVNFLTYFFLFLSIASVLVFGELNLLRAASFLWLVYCVFLGYWFDNHYLNLAFIPLFFFVQSPSILFLINALSNYQEIFVPFINFHNFNKVMNWVRNNLPENATFLIDGGGSGCTGASASYGERIFPLTSRKIFYFSNYCWADYDREEYRKRVDLYRRISINASCCINELKAYNITHIFIGEKWVGLDPKQFDNTTYFKLVYSDENGYKIYEVL